MPADESFGRQLLLALSRSTPAWRPKRVPLATRYALRGLIDALTRRTPAFSGRSLTNLSDASFPGANLTSAYFVGINLRGANFDRAFLALANFTRADLTRANCHAAHLRGADLSAANLSHADFGDANLSHASLAGANLRGTDLRGANLRSAELAGAVWDRSTAWPVDWTEVAQRRSVERPKEPGVFEVVPEGGNWAQQGVRV
jgi:hypothetical protein